MEPIKDNNTPLKIALFVSFQVSLNGRSLTDFATDKARALLVYLLIEHQQPHRRESLATLLWPDQPDARARQNLRQALSNLRQALGDTDESTTPYLLIDRHEVQFNPQATVWLDVAEFVALSDACKRHHHRHPSVCLPCLRCQEAMLTLYPGDFLAGFSLTDSNLFEEWVLLKREWLHIQAVEALGQLADFYERRGDYAPARRYAQQMVRLEPWREESHRQLMRLLAHEGQRSAALAQYETCRRVLARELGVAPTAETDNLHTAIREAVDLPRLAAKRPAVAALSAAATPFVGRAVECAELAEMLADPDSRLITLLGTGGTGKTRLAMQVAAAHVGLYADGVYWVALAAIHTADLIIPTLAQALGFGLYGKEPPEKQLLAYLREKRMLLVLDNVEHLPEIADVVAALLQHAPQVNLLVTSRERLALREEWLFAVEGLASTAEAAQLFVQTVQRTYRKFVPTAVDEAAIVEICQLVEGMPLALELAAAWIPERDCQTVAQGLAADMALLISTLRNVPERQRSVRATFEYSWVLLSEAERLLFARLAVFRGGFTAAAAAQVAELNAAELTRLAAKSLVREGENRFEKLNATHFDKLNTTRYLLHELLRQFAALKLADFNGEATTTAARHAAYYLAFLADQESALKGTGQEAALARIDEEIANVRQAWAWAVAEVEAGAQSAAELMAQALESLFLYYALHSWYQEGAAVFARAVTAVSASSRQAVSASSRQAVSTSSTHRVSTTLPHNHLLRGELLARQARCLEFTAPSEQAVALYQESLACLRAVEAERETALPLYGLGYMAHIQGDYDASRRYFGESLAQYQAAGDQWGMANVQSSLCLTLRRQGAFAEAAEAAQASLLIRREIGDRRGVASSQNNLGLIYCALGEFPAAEEALQESIHICREMGHTVGVANALTSLCHVFVDAREYDRAARTQREAQGLFQEVGDLWGVAIAYNNLGQIALETGQPEQALMLLEKAAPMYRELGIQSSLAHTLSNLGKTSAELGDVTAAAAYLREGLAVAAEIGDRPIALEMVVTMAVLGEQLGHNGRYLTLLAFALQQPELFAETRKTAVAHYAVMQKKYTQPEITAAETAAKTLDFQTALSQLLIL